MRRTSPSDAEPADSLATVESEPVGAETRPEAPAPEAEPPPVEPVEVESELVEPETVEPGLVEAETVEAEVVRRLGRVSTSWRAVVLLAGVVLVVWGTVFGNDVYWPFGPMSQFAFRVGRDDAIHSTFLEARTSAGQIMIVPLTISDVGIGRAEIEGQQPRFIRQPSMLQALQSSYARLHPGQPGLTQLWLSDRVTRLHNGRDNGTYEATLVGWPVNSQGPVINR